MNIVQYDMETQQHEVFSGQKMVLSNISRKQQFHSSDSYLLSASPSAIIPEP